MTVPKNTYVGRRYIPKLFQNPNDNSATWTNSVTHESLTIVMWQGASYTSKQDVPIGIDINDTRYWTRSADYNAQISIYEQNVRDYHQYVIDQIGIITTDNTNFQNTINNDINDFKNDVNTSLIENSKHYSSTTINLEYFINNGDNGDYALAFNRAITFFQNNNYGTLVLPSGTLTIKSNINNISKAFSIIGSGENGTIIQDLRTNSDIPTFRFNVENNVIPMGFALSGFTLDGNNKKGTALQLGVSSGWDFKITHIMIKRYDGIAIDSKSNDGVFDTVLISECGSKTLNSDNSISYAVELTNNANMNHFVNCHLEHCRFFLKTANSFLNDFTNCKFEQSSYAVGIESTESPIVINYNNENSNEISFNHCTFLGIGELNYIDAHSAWTIDNIPYFIKILLPSSSSYIDNGMVKFNNCISRTGTGSGGYSAKVGYMSLINSAVRCSIVGCHLSLLTGTRNSIIVANYSNIIGNTLQIKNNSGESSSYILLPSNGYGIWVNSNSNVQGNVFYGMFSSAISGSYAIKGSNVKALGNTIISLATELATGSTANISFISITANDGVNSASYGAGSVWCNKNPYVNTNHSNTDNREIFTALNGNNSSNSFYSGSSDGNQPDLGMSNARWKNVFASGFISGGIYTTATRPATNLQVGCMIYDSTLKIPIWWNGTNWTNASGTNV